jgi:WD40 repeat protein/DNA-binding SARP family transcriptional activator
MPTLSLSLLGSTAVTLHGESLLPMRTNKVQALLSYLVSETVFAPGVASRREALMTLLWPEMPDSSARQNLRQAIYLLRQTIPEITGPAGNVPFLLSDYHTVQVNPQAHYELDLASFAGSILDGQPAALVKAVTLYRGDFLSDFYLENSNEYEEWAAARRAVLRLQTLEALAALADHSLAQSDYVQAEAYAQRQVAMEPLREEGHRQLIRTLARSGRRSAAVAAYDELTTLLRAELDVEPELQTQQLIQSVRQGKSHALSAPGRVRGYELRTPIGEGSFGIVYRAIQPAVGREVAIKAIRRRFSDNPEFIRRFEAEAHLVARLEHPHIVPLYDYWREPGGAYLVMRWMRGGSVADTLKQGPYPVEAVLTVLDQVGAALAVAHGRGIIHRDLKPANILLDEGGNAYLSDFGIAKDLHANEALTGSGTVVGSPYYAAPEQLLSEPVSPQTDIYSLGLTLYELLVGAKPYADATPAALYYKQLHEPLPLARARRPELPAALDEVLRRATAKQPAERFPDITTFAETMRAAFREATHVQRVVTVPAAVSVNPYKGLRPFEEADAARFFGRETLVEQLLARMAGSRFLAVVGPSGSGKSSVVKAGLLPALRRGALPDSDGWFISEMVPGTHPLEELEAALFRVAVNPPETLLPLLGEDERGLARAVKRILPATGTELLLLVDQFEEIFTLVTDEAQRHFFLNSLAAAVADVRGRLRLVITLRADFYDRPLMYQTFGELMRQYTAAVVPPSKEDLAAAIRRPAQQVGVRVEDDLQAEMVADVYDRPGALPLLQYALTELFEGRESGRMTLAAYESVGRVSGALRRRAETLYGQLAEQEQLAARQLFLRLVALGEAGQVTRRRVARSELEAIRLAGEEAAAAVSRILDLYGRYRLLTFDHDPATRTPTVEVAHEALLTAWNRLREWIEVGGEDLRQQRRLRRWALEWQEAGRQPGLLLRSARLEQMAGWAAQSDLALSGPEAALLEASLAARRERAAAEEARRQRELEMAQQLARRHEYAEQQRRLAVSRELAAAAQVLLARDPELSIMLSLQALNEAHTVQAENMVHQAIATARVEHTLPVHEYSNHPAPAFSPEGTLLAASNIKTHIWDVKSGRLLQTLVNDDNVACGLAFDASGKRLAVGYEDGSIRIWSLPAGREEMTLTSDLGLIGYVAFSPDDRLLVTGGEQKSLVWDLASGQERYKFSDEAVYIAISPDDRLLAFTTGDGNPRSNVSVRDLNSGEHLTTLSVPARTKGLRFSPNGRMLATEADVAVMIWNLDLDSPETFGQQLATLDGARRGNGYSTINFLPDNRHVIFQGGDEQIKVWDIEVPREVSSFPCAPGLHWIVTNSPGTMLAATTMAGEIKLCRLGPTYEWFTVAYNTEMRGVAFNPDGSHIYTASIDGRVGCWDVTKPGIAHPGQEELVMESPTPNNAFRDVKLSPDGSRLAVASGNGMAYLWETGTGRNVAAFGKHDKVIMRVAFSPDGSRLATVSDDGTVELWEVATAAEIHTLRIGDAMWPGIDVAFHPDGQLLVASGVDTVQCWDVGTGTKRFQLENKASVVAVGFSPDGRYLAEAGNERIVFLWDMTEIDDNGLPTLVRHLSGHLETITTLAFSPDGTRLAAGGFDDTVRVWDVASGEEILTLRAHSDVIWTVAFSPDGKRLATASWDGTVRVFLLELDEVVELAYSRLTRWFTPDECRRYLHTDTCPPPPKQIGHRPQN